MKKMPEIRTDSDGSKLWEKEFDRFTAKVYVPKCDLPVDIVNFGFRAPYLLIFEEKRQTLEEARSYADKSGLARIAATFGGSVVWIYPSNEGGWKNAPSDLFEAIIEESKISQYYENGVAIMRNRFTKEWGDCFIRGAVLRTYIYGKGESADYIALNLLRKIEGEGLYGKGDITPVVCCLEGLSVLPKIDRYDIPVVSIGNSQQVNEKLKAGVCEVYIKEHAEYEKDFKQFIGNFRRMMGQLEKETDYEKLQMKVEPDYCHVKTSSDNEGDDQNTEAHKVGYVAYYNKRIMEEKKKVPLVMCFHGGGDSAMCMASVSGWPMIAYKHHFILVCVEHHMNSTATEMMEVIGELKKKYPIDEEKIYSTGFSMGGCKSWDMYQEYPKVFAAIAPMDATFDVGLNVYGQRVESINEETIVPTFYVGGEQTPLPELPFQEEKCTNRMAYVLKVNQAKRAYDVRYEERAQWQNPIWGIDGDAICKLHDPVRKGELTLQLFESENGCCYSIFGSVSNQAHEVRQHSCEMAWHFMNAFRRLADGSLEGGNMKDIEAIYKKLI